jgi:methionyl-tRNA formyltransferase
MKTPDQSYDIFWIKYYKKQGLMSNMIQTQHLPRVLFFGMEGRFSYPPLHALLEAGIQVCAVVVPAEQSFQVELPAIQKQEQQPLSHSILPVLNSSIHPSILDLARERKIPVWKVRQLSNLETTQVLTVYQPDMICVACFSKHIPHDILDIPRLGCLNVHPSLLPANRGPEPLFWAFRDGSGRTGITIHLMDEGLDSGAIVAQHAIEIPDGISYSELEERSAVLGGKLLAQSVWDMYNGVAVLVRQDETKSSYHAFPRDNDFVVPVAEWNARHVYNFICGVASWGTQIHILVDDKIVHIKKAISYSHETIDANVKFVNEQPDVCFWVRCKQGSVLVG